MYKYIADNGDSLYDYAGKEDIVVLTDKNVIDIHQYDGKIVKSINSKQSIQDAIGKKVLNELA